MQLITPTVVEIENILENQQLYLETPHQVVKLVQLQLEGQGSVDK